MYYFITWFLIALSAFANYNKCPIIAKRIFVKIAWWMLVLIAGLRYETGIDYLTYVNIYNESSPLSAFSFNDTYIEPAYALLNSLFKSLGLDINFMFLLISFVSINLMFNSYKKYATERYYMIGVLMYYSITYFLLDMSGVRQVIALNLFVYSIRFISTNRFFLFLLFIIIASLFHRSAIILLIVYPISKCYIKSWVHLLLLSVGILFMLLKIKWIEFIFSLIGLLFVSGPLATKLLDFTTNSFFQIERSLTVGIVLYVPVFVLAVCKRKRLEAITPYYNIILNIFLFFIITVFYLYESYDISNRFSSYFSFSFGLCLAFLLSQLKQKKYNLLLGFCIVFFISLFAMRNTILPTNTSIMYHPYQNYIFAKMGLVESTAEQRLKKFDNINNN